MSGGEGAGLGVSVTETTTFGPTVSFDWGRSVPATVTLGPGK